MKRYELIVIGAGPGGASAAAYAAQAGIRTLLMDRVDFPRDKTCGDGLTPRAVYELQQLGLEKELTPRAHVVRAIRVVSPGGFETSVEIPQQGSFPPFAWVIPRLLLDVVIRDRAVALGAEFAAPLRATSLEAAGSGVQVRARGKHGEDVFFGRRVIVATGAAMPLLKQAGLLSTTPDVIRAVRGYFEAEQPFTERMEFRFDHVPLPGYGWLFPVGDQQINIGLGYWPGGSRKSRELSVQRALKRFLVSPGLQREFGPLKQIGEVKSYPLRTDFATARTFGRGLILVGEAAGLVNPLTGEGIDYALESGRIAGSYLAAHGLEAELAGYDVLLRQAFQPIFKFSSRVQRVGMSAFALDLLTRWAERRADLKRLLTRLMLGTLAVPERVSPWKVLRVLAGI